MSAATHARPLGPEPLAERGGCSCWSCRSCCCLCFASARLCLNVECFQLQGRSMLPTLQGGPGPCDSDVVAGLRPSRKVALKPRVGDIVILVDENGRMVKRLRHIAEEVCEHACVDWECGEKSGLRRWLSVLRGIWAQQSAGPPGRAWCWVEGDNAPLSEDSRVFGWVPSHRIEAVAIGVSWPPWRAKWLIEPSRLREALSPLPSGSGGLLNCWSGIRGWLRYFAQASQRVVLGFSSALPEIVPRMIAREAKRFLPRLREDSHSLGEGLRYTKKLRDQE
ncbi:unnamed protein product [Polarella glacialis]|uniref:Uncharacterized protein n=1 Tax=Polarella glacialis TaxID=89957 RepID=A0A813J5Q6_POLGL|nr:unnamed protein product [Polarella glacialis]